MSPRGSLSTIASTCRKIKVGSNIQCNATSIHAVSSHEIEFQVLVTYFSIKMGQCKTLSESQTCRYFL